jgi:hypothetical protein
MKNEINRNGSAISLLMQGMPLLATKQEEKMA